MCGLPEDCLPGLSVIIIRYGSVPTPLHSINIFFPEVYDTLNFHFTNHIPAVKKLIIICAFLLALCSFSGLAQQIADTTLYEVETSDGNRYVGPITVQNDSLIKLKTRNLGEITIQRAEVVGIRALASAKKVNGAYWLENLQSGRYLFQPSGYGLREGEAYYQNIWIFWNQVSVGISDYFTAGIGVVPLFLFAGAATPVWITPKFSFPVVKNRVNVGVGALAGTVVGERDASFGIAYGVSTLGSKDKNVSVGLGYGYAGGDWASSPTITLSGMLRTGRRWYLLTENYYIGSAGDDIMLLSAGGRWMINRVSIDGAVVIPTNIGGEVVMIPILGITVPFGNTQTSRGRE